MKKRAKKVMRCDVCGRKPATHKNLDGGRVCDKCYKEGYSDEMPDFDDADAEADAAHLEAVAALTAPRKVNQHETLVNRLRMPIDPSRSIIHMDNDITNLGLRAVADKMDAIGEALAYIIDRKWARVKSKKLVRQIKNGKRLK